MICRGRRNIPRGPACAVSFEGRAGEGAGRVAVRAGGRMNVLGRGGASRVAGYEEVLR